MSLIYPNTPEVKTELTKLDEQSLVPEITGLLAGWDNRTPHATIGTGTYTDTLLENNDVLSDLVNWFIAKTEQLELRGSVQILLGKVGLSGQIADEWHSDHTDRATITFADAECPVNPSTSIIRRPTSPTKEQTMHYEAEITPLLYTSPMPFASYTGIYLRQGSEGSIVTLFDSTIHSETTVPDKTIKLSLVRFK